MPAVTLLAVNGVSAAVADVPTVASDAAVSNPALLRQLEMFFLVVPCLRLTPLGVHCSRGLWCGVVVSLSHHWDHDLRSMA